MIRTLMTVAALSLTVTAAQAGTATVNFGDLNIASPQDARVLGERIHQAAATVCESDKPYSGASSLFYRSAEITCVRWTSQRVLKEILARAGEHRQIALQ